MSPKKTEEGAHHDFSSFSEIMDDIHLEEEKKKSIGTKILKASVFGRYQLQPKKTPAPTLLRKLEPPVPPARSRSFREKLGFRKRS